MTEKDVIGALESSGVPFRLVEWKDKAPIPFGCYRYAGSTNFHADGTVYVPKRKLIIEVYDITGENEAFDKVKKALTDLGLDWEEAITHLSEEDEDMLELESEVIYSG